jgi:Putative restriction endonuclease
MPCAPTCVPYLVGNCNNIRLTQKNFHAGARSRSISPVHENMHIPEYWIIDYKALGGRKFIGNPKVPTIFVCELIDGEYQMTPFRGTDRIVSPTFLQLNLSRWAGKFITM